MYFNIFKGVDGQVFQHLAAGTYTIFIEATASDNTNEVVYDTVGPVLLAAGANASISEAIGKYNYPYTTDKSVTDLLQICYVCYRLIISVTYLLQSFDRPRADQQSCHRSVAYLS